MTGILSSTRGEVYYDNVPIQGNETEICKQFGYCPQFDSFSNSLTVREHVQLFAGIKGIKVDVNDVLTDVDLYNKRNDYPNELSGGQKRKLGITLALLGSPKFVFLDEPTTGLDPYSRKSIWELLLRKKNGCTLFITTHYMDEADLLADRKMIISNGSITCLGTSLFLKNSFNMNYALDINTTNPMDNYYTDYIIDRYCPGSSKTRNITVSQCNEESPDKRVIDSRVYIITYLLPMRYSYYFKNILNALNKMIKDPNNGLSNFSLTSPTLEELFIKLESNKGGRDNTLNGKTQKMENPSAIDINSGSKNSRHSEWNGNNNDSERLVSQLNPIFGKTIKTKSSSLRQIYSILKIRIKMFLRNKIFALLYTLIPTCLIIAAVYYENKYITSLDSGDRLFKPLEIKPSLYEDIKWFQNPSASNGVALDIINRINSKMPLEIMDYDKQLTVSSNQLAKNSKYNGGIAGVVDNNDQSLRFTIYTEYRLNYVIPIAINQIYNAFLEQNNVNQKISVTYNQLPKYGEYFDENDENNIINVYPEEKKEALEPILLLAIAITISLSASTFGPMTIKEKEEGITWQLYLNGTRRKNYWMGIFLGDAICLLIPISLVMMAGYFNGIVIFDQRVIVCTIVVTILWIFGSIFHQYVVCHFFKKYDKCSKLFILINPILFLFIGIFCIYVSLTNNDILDKTDFFRYHKYNDDSSDNGHQVIKYIFYFIAILYAPSTLLFYYIKLTSFINNRKFNFTTSDTQAFGNSKIYQDIMANPSLSKVEKSRRTAAIFYDGRFPSFTDILKCDELKMVIGFALVVSVIYIVVLCILEKSQKKKLFKCNKEYSEEEKAIKNKKLREGPRDVFNEFHRIRQSIENINVRNIVALKAYRLNKDYTMTKKEMENINNNDKDNNKKKNKKDKEDKNDKNDKNDNYDKKDKKNNYDNYDKNDNYDNNDNHDKNNNHNKSAFEKMDNRIIYDKDKNVYFNRIVDDVTFGVDIGQCLGLLGPNGAGKTTSIFMITGLISRTHGRVIYGTKDLNNADLSELSLGYCSQTNSLWKFLTVKETIQFYLNICGYPHKEIPYYTKALAEACGIENHMNKKVSEISGGTKRKLSFIISICSSPDYLILDEPSAGMDPFTRRYMWRLISQLKKVRETATILTTHSTEEAEALCDRIAILIKGNLVCIDTPRSIKMNKSNRYVLEVFTDYPEQFEKVYVKRGNLFGLTDDEHYDLENSISYQKYTVEMKLENIANVFSYMEYAKKVGHIKQYNFGQYSLEQIFIDFVNNTD